MLHDCKCLSEAQLAEALVLTQTWTSCVKTEARVHAVMYCCVTLQRIPRPGTQKTPNGRSVSGSRVQASP